MTDAPPATVLLTTAPDRAAAQALAHALVERRLAACVQLCPIDSVYRWEGQVRAEPEVLLLVKTRADLAGAVQRALAAAHPYAVPEILVLPVSSGLPAYLAWIAAETGEGA